MRLATWNVNSIRARVDRVTDWLERGDVDVLAMQETKCADDQFPTMPFAALGYEVVHCGFNQWNGVAIASRVGIDDVQVGFDGQPTWGDKPDVEAVAESEIVDGGLPRASVVAVPHHGSLTSSTARFVAAAHPALALVSAGYRNRWGLPRPEVAERWRAAGARVLTTADSGAIEITLSAGRPPLAREYRQTRRRYWHR